MKRSQTPQGTDVVDPEIAFLIAAAWASETNSIENARSYALHRSVAFGAMGRFLEGVLSIQPPGLIRPFAPPRYPLQTAHDVYYCDMEHWVDDFWAGLNKHEELQVADG